MPLSDAPRRQGPWYHALGDQRAVLPQRPNWNQPWPEWSPWTGAQAMCRAFVLPPYG